MPTPPAHSPLARPADPVPGEPTQVTGIDPERSEAFPIPRRKTRESRPRLRAFPLTPNSSLDQNGRRKRGADEQRFLAWNSMGLLRHSRVECAMNHPKREGRKKEAALQLKFQSLYTTPSEISSQPQKHQRIKTQNLDEEKADLIPVGAALDRATLYKTEQPLRGRPPLTSHLP